MAKSHVGIGSVKTINLGVRIPNETSIFDKFDTSGLVKAEFVVVVGIELFPGGGGNFIGVVAEKFKGVDGAGIERPVECSFHVDILI